MSTLLLDGFVKGKAVAKVYDHNGHPTAIGRYQVVKWWVTVDGRSRESISYRHQLPAAKRLAVGHLEKYGEVSWRVAP